MRICCGVLARAPFFTHSLYCAMAAASDDSRNGHKADEHKDNLARCSRSLRFHLVNDRQTFVVCGIFVGNVWADVFPVSASPSAKTTNQEMKVISPMPSKD
jgi:hypothetical protein